MSYYFEDQNVLKDELPKEVTIYKRLHKENVIAKLAYIMASWDVDWFYAYLLSEHMRTGKNNPKNLHRNIDSNTWYMYS